MSLRVTDVLLRLAIACICGGIIGLNRGRKNRPAGIRTHVIICIGSALTVMLGMYFSSMINGGAWTDAAVNAIDVTRISAQVISGIGFIGVGTIMVTGKQKIKGLTTAAGLWASACMGLAIGSGFYYAALLGCILIAITVAVLGRLESSLFTRSRNMSVFVEFHNIEGISSVIEALQNIDIDVLNVDITTKTEGVERECAVLSMKLPKGIGHEVAILTVGTCECIYSVEEL